jgi:hypothetical protein
MFDSLCQGDIDIFHAASAELEKIHHKLHSIGADRRRSATTATSARTHH